MNQYKIIQKYKINSKCSRSPSRSHLHILCSLHYKVFVFIFMLRPSQNGSINESLLHLPLSTRNAAKSTGNEDVVLGS